VQANTTRREFDATSPSSTRDWPFDLRTRLAWPPPRTRTRTRLAGWRVTTWEQWEVGADEPPTWDPDRYEQRFVTITEAGWPLPMLRHVRAGEAIRTSAGATTRTVPLGAWSRGIAYGERGHRLPVRPAPFAWLVNGLALGLSLLALLTVAAALRGAVRRERGRCPSCGYDRRGVDAARPCPECGDRTGPAR